MALASVMRAWMVPGLASACVVRRIHQPIAHRILADIVHFSGDFPIAPSHATQPQGLD
jgi:hypothetical protein